MPAHAIDVSEEAFEREVLVRSRDVPVVVDFWAPWCGPCRTLGPLLEQLAEEHAGAFVLARVDVDQAPVVAQQLEVRSIPTVLGIRDGAVVSGFVGAQPPEVVRRFVEAILPTEADRLAREGSERLEEGDATAAEARFRDALEKEAHHPRALLGLARVLADRDENDGALELLERVSPSSSVARDAEHLATQLRVRTDAGGDVVELRQRIAEHPKDLHARIALGRTLAAAAHYEDALSQLLEAVRLGPEFDEEAARKAMVDVFELLGPTHELTERFRRELARALFR